MANKHYLHGIKVRLRDGWVGRVKKAAGPATKEHARSFADLGAKPIPEIEDKHNEFKEFYQYDAKIDHFADSMGVTER